MRIEVVQGDATLAEGDVLVLKYAQASYGLDAHVADCLQKVGHDEAALKPKEGEYRLFPGEDVVVAKKILFVGVSALRYFGYQEIRDFGKHVLAVLADEAPETRHIVVTVHGPGYGLDEEEAFESLLAGFVDAMSISAGPASLEVISILERNPGRSKRLQQALQRLFPIGIASPDYGTILGPVQSKTVDLFRSVGSESDNKAHAFVAMPFSEKFDDIYHYGVSNAVKKVGLLCERADISVFTGDVMGWVRERVKTATIVIADLTGANPNVYLEVGFAWGCQVPTVLVAQERKDLLFDVKGQRCLIYKKIKDLEEMLAAELRSLRC